MARAATTTDAFSAVSDPQRRQLLIKLIRGERTVGGMVADLKWSQPRVSKHLSVLRRVGLVTVRREGRLRHYRINGDRLKAIHDWTVMFEQLWDHQLDRIKQSAEAKAKAVTPQPDSKSSHPKEP